MELLKALEDYTIAQKFVGTSFVFIGIALLGFAIINHFAFQQTELTKGLKIGAFVCGILIIIGGFSYKNFSSKTEQKQIVLHNQSENEFINQESIRMEKVVKDYPIYQIVFGSIIILAVLLVLLINKAFWQGIAFSTVLLFTAVMIVEAHSHKSILNYRMEIEKK